MRAVVQRVVSASVAGKCDSRSTFLMLTVMWIVEGEIISQISRGLMVLVGIGKGLSAIRVVFYMITHTYILE
jgi:D-Tyr-tRNAtyr deacylase